jgi:two-component system KDP operon response regulator KdpE
MVRRVLQAEGFSVREAQDGAAALRLCDQSQPDVIILDISLPELNGFQILERIRLAGDTPVIMLTSKRAEDDKVRAFGLGADDYLTKPFSSRELTARVKAVLRRTHSTAQDRAPSMLVVGDIQIDLAEHKVLVGQRPVALSRTEFSVLAELARSAGRVVTHQQLLTWVWGPEYRDEEHVLRTVIYRLRLKIEPDQDRPRYILRQPDVGYWLATPDEAQT